MMMDKANYQPRDLIMDLMRAVAPDRLHIKILIGVGSMFGFNDNQVRVAVTRLCQSQQLVCLERGSYGLGELGQESVLLSRDWHIGENRLRAWDESWFMVALPPALERSRHRRALQALQHSGFRQGLRGVFVRPANLWLGTVALRQRLQRLGLDASCQLWNARDISQDLIEVWKGLWDAETWEAGHRSSRLQLESSLANLHKLSPEEQMRETFVLGGESIRLLVTDPLLPDAIAGDEERKLHTAAMQTYDKTARKIWFSHLQDLESTS